MRNHSILYVGDSLIRAAYWSLVAWAYDKDVHSHMDGFMDAYSYEMAALNLSISFSVGQRPGRPQRAYAQRARSGTG